jgi:hypothetical protein
MFLLQIVEGYVSLQRDLSFVRSGYKVNIFYLGLSVNATPEPNVE